MKTHSCIVAVVALAGVIAFTLVVQAQSISGLSGNANLDVPVPFGGADDPVMDNLTADQLKGMSDAEAAPIYVRGITTYPSHGWKKIVDADVFSRPGSGRIFKHLIQYPIHRSLRGGLWGWLAAHPSYPYGPELLNESIRIFHAEGRSLGGTQLMGLAEFIAAIGTPEQAQLLDEIGKAGAIGIDISKHRYAKRLEAASPSTPNTTKNLNEVNSSTAPEAAAAASLKNSKATLAVASKERLAITPWLMWPVMILVALGLSFLVFKRRK